MKVPVKGKNCAARYKGYLAKKVYETLFDRHTLSQWFSRCAYINLTFYRLFTFESINIIAIKQHPNCTIYSESLNILYIQQSFILSELLSLLFHSEYSGGDKLQGPEPLSHTLTPIFLLSFHFSFLKMDAFSKH